MKRGDVVQFTGLGASPGPGVVESAGPVTCLIRWANGYRGRVTQNYRYEALAAARETLGLNGDTVARMAKPNPIQVVPSGRLFRLTRPGARYAVHLNGDERPGAWLPDGEALPAGWIDTYPENEARALLPFLRVRGTAGRPGAEPTTADGKLVARACKRLGLSAVALAETIGAHESVLSRARHGELPEVYREAIKALIQGKRTSAS